MAELILWQGASIVKSHHMDCTTEAQPLHGHAHNPSVLTPLSPSPTPPLATVRGLASSAHPLGKVEFYNYLPSTNARCDMGFVQFLLLINMQKI